MPSLDRCRRLAVTGTHSSGKNYTSRVLYELGFRNFLQEPLNPLSPPGIWMPKKDRSYTYCDSLSSASKQAMIRRKLFGLTGLPLSARPASIRDYASLWKAALTRIGLWRFGQSFVIKDPFCLFVADLLKTSLDISPWIIIRHPADFVAHCLRNNVRGDFSSFEWDPEFCDRLGGFFNDVQSFARNPAHASYFHQNIAYWMMCAKTALHLCQRWGPSEGYALTLLDTLNANPERTFACSLGRCGLHPDLASIPMALEAAQADVKLGSLSRLQQTRDVLAKPSKEERLRPLTPAMLEEVHSATHELYAQLEALEAGLQDVDGSPQAPLPASGRRNAIPLR